MNASSQSSIRPISRNGCTPEAALARLGDCRDLYASVVGRFLNDSAGTLPQLSKAIETLNCSDTQRFAHSLKGLAAMCGADAVAMHCASLEDAAKAGESTKLAKHWQATLQALDEARPLLQSYTSYT